MVGFILVHSGEPRGLSGALAFVSFIRTRPVGRWGRQLYQCVPLGLSVSFGFVWFVRACPVHSGSFVHSG